MLTSQLILSNLPSDTENIFIGFSGGKDSHVLLHLVASIPLIQSKITAVYVHHGLQEEADEWEKYCQLIALDLQVNFQCLTVNVQKKNRQSQEELARDARYHAFKRLLSCKDILFLAQHREDQLETVLLQLFRGAGVQGLAAMPLSIAFGKGRMIRPLLDVSQRSINDYAEQHQLNWIEDPSNQNNDFKRNYLRNQIIPHLKQHWPALDKTVSRSARHCANSFMLNQNLAKQLLDDSYDQSDGSLDIKSLLSLDKNKQKILIRQWFTQLQLRMPSEVMTLNMVNEIAKAKQSANPELKNNSYCIKRYRNKIFALELNNINLTETGVFWGKEMKTVKLNNSALNYYCSSAGISQSTWNNAEVWVRFRQGSEKIKLPGRQGHHTLKKIFQEQAIPPWERMIIPLIYLNGQLAAVADLWVSADFLSKEKDNCLKFNWIRNSR